MSRPVWCTQCWTQFDMIKIERILLSKEAGKTVYLDRSIIQQCPVCHPEPALKHDGSLNADGTHNVYPNNFNGISGEGGAIGLSAREAISLLAWLKQEEVELERLAKQEDV